MIVCAKGASHLVEGSRVQCLQTHFSHILVCHALFLVIIYFSKKQHFLKSRSHSLVAQNICKAFFYNVTTMGKI